MTHLMTTTIDLDVIGRFEELAQCIGGHWNLRNILIGSCISGCLQAKDNQPQTSLLAPNNS
jgi:hypothetical protein